MPLFALKSEFTANDVARCLALVVSAGPYLECTTDDAWMQRLDACAADLLETAFHLEDSDYAAYAAALWPWCLERGHYGAALDMLLYSRATWADDVPLRVRVRACIGIGVLWQREQNFVQADAYLNHALRMCGFLHDDFLLAHVHHFLGLLYRRTARYEEAGCHHQVSLDIWSRLDDSWGMATALDALGVLHTKINVLDAAHAFFSRARELSHSIGDKKQTARILNNLGLVAAQRGMLEHALNAYSQSGCIFRETNDINSMGLSLYNQGDICFEMGQYTKAQALLIQSLEIACRLEYTVYAPDAVNNLAFIAQRIGQIRQAAALLGASETLGQQRASALPVYVQATYAACESNVKKYLHPVSRAALRKKGRRMSLSDVLAYIQCKEG